MKRILALLLCLSLLLVGCGGASSPETTAETISQEELLQEYKLLIKESNSALVASSIILGDAAVYESNYMQNYKKVAGWAASEDNVLKVLGEYLAEKYNATTDALTQYFNDNSEKYKEITLAPVPEGAEKIAEIYDEAFTAYLGLYNAVMSPGTSQSSFATTASECLDKLTETTNKLGILLEDVGGSAEETTAPETTVPEPSETTAETIETSSIETSPEEATEPVAVGMANALNKAHSYLKHSAFSYSRLISQLEYEGYTTEEATYAADNCGADWDEQACKKAERYLENSAFSYSGLIGQLEYEGFSTEQATQAVDNCGADWNEQAVKKAEKYLSHSSFSKDRLISQLEYEGFTHEQAVYGAAQNGYE